MTPESTPGDEASKDLLEVCVGQMENIAMASEAAEFVGLSSLSCIINDYLGDPDRESDFSQAEGQLLVNWTNNVQSYIRNSNESSVAEKLLEPLPTEQRAGLLEALLEKGAEVRVIESQRPVDPSAPSADLAQDEFTHDSVPDDAQPRQQRTDLPEALLENGAEVRVNESQKPDDHRRFQQT